jgi:hypothetical protein
MNELPNNCVQQIWQSQLVEVAKMSIIEIRRRADKFERRVWWRNAREYVAGLIGVALWGSFFLKTHELPFRVAYGLFIAGIIWILIQLHRKASARSVPLEADTATSLRLYRAELERQRDVFMNVWPWYLAPLVPAFVVFTVVDAISHPYPMKWAKLALLDTLVAAVFLGTWRLNHGAAHRLQSMIDKLNSMEERDEMTI